MLSCFTQSSCLPDSVDRWIRTPVNISRGIMEFGPIHLMSPPVQDRKEAAYFKNSSSRFDHLFYDAIIQKSHVVIGYNSTCRPKCLHSIQNFHDTFVTID